MVDTHALSRLCSAKTKLLNPSMVDRCLTTCAGPATRWWAERSDADRVSLLRSWRLPLTSLNSCLVGQRRFVKCTCCNARHTEPAGGKDVEGIVHPLLDWLHGSVIQCDDCGAPAPASFLLPTATASRVTLSTDDDDDDDCALESFRVANLACIALSSKGNSLHLRASPSGTNSLAVELFLATRLALRALQQEVLVGEQERMLLRLEVAVLAGFVSSLCVASCAWTAPRISAKPRMVKEPVKKAKKEKPAKPVKPQRVRAKQARPVQATDDTVEVDENGRPDGCCHVSCRLARQLKDMDDSQFEGLLSALVPATPTSSHMTSCGRGAEQLCA